MAVPKKRTGKSAQAKRRANWKATVPATTTCKNCNSLVLTHTVCPECGYYKQAAVSIKNENYVAPDAQKAEKKAPAKKAAAKPKAPKAEVKPEETKAEVTTEDVKVEEVTEVAQEEKTQE